MNITLRQLEIFEKVAETEHITKASEKLFISQSAVSMAISELEKETGGLLFERRGRRLLINERGRILFSRVKDILYQVNSTKELLNDLAQEPAGVLHVGASTSIANYLLPMLIGSFTKQYPKAEVLLIVGNTQQIEEGVNRGELDLGLVEGPSHLNSLDCRPWRTDELVVISSLDHPWAKSGKATLDMLASERWIAREKGSGTREVFETAMLNQVGVLNIGLELGHTEAIKKAVEAGLGVSCLSRLAVQREIENNWLVEISTPLNLKRMLSILVHRDKYKSKLFTAFISSLEVSRFNTGKSID